MELSLLLKIYGIEWIFTEPFDPYLKRYIKCYNFKKSLNLFYFLFVNSVLWAYPVFEIYVSYKKERRELFSEACFWIISGILHIILCGYFKSQVIKRLYESKTENKNVNKNLRWRCLPDEKTLVNILYMSSFSIILLNYVSYFIWYNYRSSHSKDLKGA